MDQVVYGVCVCGTCVWCVVCGVLCVCGDCGSMYPVY